MSIAACYVVNVQCDRKAEHVGEAIPRDQFTGENRRTALSAMTRAGWRYYTPMGGDVVLCPACVEAGHTTADGVNPSVAQSSEGEKA
jgi:hypothetical protein